MCSKSNAAVDSQHWPLRSSCALARTGNTLCQPTLMPVVDEPDHRRTLAELLLIVFVRAVQWEGSQQAKAFGSQGQALSGAVLPG